MNHRDVEDRTQSNPAAERYLALLEEHRLFEERMQKALAHREAFSEKVLAKVTSDYRTKIDQLARETAALESQLQTELASFEKQLESALPARQRFHEELEELELRHLTGEITTKEYTRRKAALDAQRPGGLADLELLQRNVEFYQRVLQGQRDAARVAGPAASEEPQFEEEPEVGPAAAESAAPGEAWGGTAEAVGEREEMTEVAAFEAEAPSTGQPWAEAEQEVWAEAEAVEEMDASAPLEPAGEEPVYFVDEPAEPHVESEEQYFDQAPGVRDLEEEAALVPPVASGEAEEEEFFQSELSDAEEPATPDWYPSAVSGDEPAFDEELAGGEMDQAMDDLDQFAVQEPLAEEDVEIPEELLLDEGGEFLEHEVPEEDSAALLQSTERLLQEDEDFEDVFNEDVQTQEQPGRPLEPAIVLREGMPDEKIFYMTNNVLSIGRGPDNDIQLSTDTSVSRHHSRITYEDDEYWIADLGSSNGTIVNGARITKTILSGDDEISIGQTVLRFKFC
jgi:FHA domain-containing protein